MPSFGPIAAAPVSTLFREFRAFTVSETAGVTISVIDPVFVQPIPVEDEIDIAVSVITPVLEPLELNLSMAAAIANIAVTVVDAVHNWAPLPIAMPTVEVVAETTTPTFLATGVVPVTAPVCNVTVSVEAPTVVHADLCNDGRKPIGVHQPPWGGTHYPLINPSEDIELLLADFYLQYANPECLFVRPFKIKWLFGLGRINNIPIEGYPAPTHDFDIIITDANDEIVFDSTTAFYFSRRAWGDRLECAFWLGTTATAQLVFHNCWDPQQLGTLRHYDRYLEPENAILDERCYEEMAPTIRKFLISTDNAGLVTVENKKLVIKSGYNIAAGLTSVEPEQGYNRETPIELTVEPGAGLGQFPGCEDVAKVLRTINGIRADDHGNFTLDAIGCYRVEIPATIDDTTATITGNSLKLSNDCDPCCQCSQYEDVYAAIVKLNNKYNSLAERAQCVRDQYAINRERWVEAGRERLSKPLRLAVLPGAGCRLQVAGAYCNNTGGCLEDLNLVFNFQYNLEGGLPPEFNGITANTELTGTAVCGTAFRSGNKAETPSQAGCVSLSTVERYTMLGDWPVYTANFELVPKGAMAYVRFQLDFENCTDTDDLEVVLEAKIGNSHITYNVGWPDNDDSALVLPIKATTTSYETDICEEE